MSAVRVGIPRTLTYYSFYPMWKTFFRELGVQVIVSNPTTKALLDKGVKETVSDACVPIKLFHGHVADLMERVDYLFLPRMVNTRGTQVYCPKFLGLPDMVRYSMDRLPAIIDERIDLRKRRGELMRVFFRIGRLFTRSRLRILLAYLKSRLSLKEFRKLLLRGYTAPEAIAIMDGEEPAPKEPSPSAADVTLAVLGYPYAIYDPYVSGNLMDKLRSLGVRPITSEMVPWEILKGQKTDFSKDMFWIYSEEAVKAGYHFIDRHGVDGIIHVTAFGCGPDSMVDKILEIATRRSGTMPFMSLMIDEHTGDAGVMTRLEAFTDMIRRRKKGFR